ncbi:phosphoenolpyruvate carboxykinase [ATP] [Spizellomyces punctatus DAOM BR117]|uniref:Phosphoenolpyruvate carboxykinase (ATP) n=1 Tax=Spizellomyces punctatus (strain DAOM BR117) TaxID=645134 RepID=A0A0L0HSV1_SPIPD|nr:phosphoenolpyruvate carboxykinase [ATP] [Spizellomyces punctatus DAOM BR117]KND03954.1 phosphoenolpyruvate carboxykinase [ATP] [Spizellomyces punctatus DAOM BR117]|eukprot:XP_016611993.1 phosphoenolpyruvate carboxykinase [ATP] [Spizellomyces punctatus DAOM BR117]
MIANGRTTGDEIHDEIHEALHTVARVDYDKPIIRNASVPVLYEEALEHEVGTGLTAAGALVTDSGAKKGRSPKDKRIVEEESSKDNVWWGPVNVKMSENAFMVNRERAIDYLNTRSRLYVFDGFAGWDPKYRIKVRIVCARAYHALFMRNMLIRPTDEELANFGEPDFTIFNAGEFPANRYTTGMTSTTSICLNFKRAEMVILGTQYAGEMKKGIFTVMHYYMPKAGVLSLHSSANEGPDGDVSLFFGLSGTGKTTLSADPHRFLIGDDEHCWSDDGIFNIEGGCYAKCIDLSAEKEPEIFNAIRFGSVLENVVYDPVSRIVDYSDSSKTENTRCAYPIEYIPNAKIPCVGGHPKNIILLTCDAFGVLPPVSKLTPEQAMYHFISGYTAKIAGTEEGVTEPQATFSTCFGAPFLVWHPVKYATMLAEKMQQHKADAWLINTGWNGGPYGVGKRVALKYSRAIIDAIHNGELAKAEYENYATFNLPIPKAVTGVPSEILNPAKTWSGTQESYATTLNKLANLFNANFKTYADKAAPEVIAAGPQI